MAAYFLQALIFMAIFAVVAGALTAFTAREAGRRRRNVVQLERALGPGALVPLEEYVDIRRDETMSTVPWLNRLLTRADFAARTRLLLAQAGAEWSVGRLILLSVTCAAAAATAAWMRTGALPFAAIAAAGAAAAPWAWVLYKRKQRFERFDEHLPAALDLIVSAVRAGHSLTSALGLVSREAPQPVAREFRICFDEQNFGVELRTAMQNLIRRVPLHDLRIAATAVLIQKDSGGNLAEILEKVAHLMRQRFQLKRQIRVHTAQGRVTGWVLTAIPLFILAAMYLRNPDYIAQLWRKPQGVRLLYAGGTMMLIGAVVIRRIINIRI